MLNHVRANIARMLFTDTTSSLDRLPAEGRAVLRHLMDRRSDLQAANLALTERYETARQHRQVVKRQIEIMVDPARSREHGWQPLADGSPRVQAERRRLQAIEADMSELQSSLASRSEKLTHLGRLIERLTRYAEGLQGHKIVAESAITPGLPKNTDLRQAVEQTRREIARLQADLRETEAAPYPSAIAKARARHAIEALTERGRPDVAAMIAHGEVEPSWPSRSLRVSLSASVATAQAAHPVIGIGSAEHVDALALVAWLHRDALIARLEEEIDAQADDAKALSDEARSTKTAEIRSAILTAEREEEAIIRLIEQEGAEFERRADADPRAILSVGGEAPLPKD